MMPIWHRGIEHVSPPEYWPSIRLDEFGLNQAASNLTQSTGADAVYPHQPTLLVQLDNLTNGGR